MSDRVLSRMMSDFCRTRAAQTLSPREVEAVRCYMLGLIEVRQRPPTNGRQFDWHAIADRCGLGEDRISALVVAVRFAFEALAREIPKLPKPFLRTNNPKNTPHSRGAGTRGPSQLVEPRDRALFAQETPPCPAPTDQQGPTEARRRGVPMRPIVEYPEPDGLPWEDSNEFSEALRLHMRRHGDSFWHLHRAVTRQGETFDRTTIRNWLRGQKVPHSSESLEILRRIERRYQLPPGYFRSKLPHSGRSTANHDLIRGIGPAERRRLAWHLPDDFGSRSPEEREQIIAWVQRVVIRGSTDYRRYQAAAMKHRFAVQFPGLHDQPLHAAHKNARAAPSRDQSRLLSGNVSAPPALMKEMEALLRFKTSTLTALGFQRVGIWGAETASQKLEHLGLLLGALSASPGSAVRGFGMPIEHLTLGLLVLPSVWDWYIKWREQRRGFFTAWEVDMLRLAQALTRQDTGWLRQSPELAERLHPTPGLVTASQIQAARHDWSGCCDAMHKFGLARVKEISRVARVHRDPFEPILPILESASPVGEYRKITEEILRLMPDERRYPRAAAEAVRSFLMLRLGLHLGLRQKNLRQLLICPPGELPLSDRRLMELRRGQLRWNDRDHGWEVFIPSIAFKNAHSSYFGNKPFQLRLPDLGGLYEFIDAYVSRHRARLLRGAEDPQTFFVKTVKTTSAGASYDQNTFYEAWRLTIQRYGIYNPYTKRGAIEGLLPHGPHNVRDVLATHILKQTGSYEQASYAIQDTPEMVAKHYGRFLPQDKAALAAQVLNKAWEVA